MIAPMTVSLIAPIVSYLIQPVASSLIKAMTRGEVGKTGKGLERGFLPFLALPLLMKSMCGRG